MANMYCVFLKFCVFCLIFVELSESNQIASSKYSYSIAEPHNLESLDHVVFRAKRAAQIPAPSSPPLSPSAAPAPSPATQPATLPTNGVAAPSNGAATASTATSADKSAQTSLPTVENQPQLLGANGTGQRKDYNTTNSAKPIPLPAATVPSPAVPSQQPTAENKASATINTSLGTVQPNASQPSVEAAISDSGTKVIDEIDEPEETINKTVNEHLAAEHLANQLPKTDYFQYYNSSTVVDKNKSDDYWSLSKDYIVSSILSKSHRRAITVQLKFDFPFYGHIVRNVTVATGGFLYTGEYVHSWLAATQYIAPLMANFDTSIGNGSSVKYGDNGTAFTVIWENVPLQEGNPAKPLQLFTFSVTLYNTGDITFAYKTIPIAIENIKDEKHPVKIGLSDAYIIDKTIYFTRRKTIYEYHRVNFNGQDIKNNTLIVLKALPTCLEHTECVSCLSADIQAFNCTWCPTLNRCSTGTDRKRQEWIQAGCERSQLRESPTCPAAGTKGNNYSTQQQVTPSPTISNNEQWISSNAEAEKNATKSTAEVKKAALSHALDPDQAKQGHTSFVLGILLPIVVMASLVLWVFYAYRNPHTKSGQLLIQYRPSQWTWRRGEARYTAATIHM